MLGFTTPILLGFLVALPLIYWLIRALPPTAKRMPFPPISLLVHIRDQRITTQKPPLWLLLVRMALVVATLLALSGPFIRTHKPLTLHSKGVALIVLETSWETALTWNERLQTLNALLEDLATQGRKVVLLTDQDTEELPTAQNPQSWQAQLSELAPLPLPTDVEGLTQRLEAIPDNFTEIHWLSTHTAPRALREALSQRTEQLLRYGDASTVYAFGPSQIKTGAIRLPLHRNNVDTAQEQIAMAYDQQGGVLAATTITFEVGQATGTAIFELPQRHINQIAYVQLDAHNSAAATYFTGQDMRRIRVALVGHITQQLAQPLLEESHYLQKAVGSHFDVLQHGQADIAEGIDFALEHEANVLILPDMGQISGALGERLQDWVATGGTLIRFAGPKLANMRESQLLPVRLRPGSRQLGGNLSWSKPLGLTPFQPDSPFFGLSIPNDVLVHEQVLAEPSLELPERIYAALTDGTPLVTGMQKERGRLVLFHVTADPRWSNLPLSGLYVKMLLRLLGRDTLETSTKTVGKTLVPLRVVDGFGHVTQPDATHRPLVKQNGPPLPTRFTPPGLYGTLDAPHALNLAQTLGQLPLISEADDMGLVPWVTSKGHIPLKPYFWILACVLLALDGFYTFWLLHPNIHAFRQRLGMGFLVLATLAGMAMVAIPSYAKEPDHSSLPDILRQTRFAYVITGDANIDALSVQGLANLGRTIALRTSLEPGAPVGITLESDPLELFPVIYWPVLASNAPIKDRTIRKLNIFMQNGGLLLLDTFDDGATFELKAARSPENIISDARQKQLFALLSSLDIGRLRRVEPGHTLTKAYFLLTHFPGQHQGSAMWAEASSFLDTQADAESLHTRQESVSRILLTGAGLTAAWAAYPVATEIDMYQLSLNQGLDMPFRAGLNIILYALTGNYKDDQVHILEILRRRER